MKKAITVSLVICMLLVAVSCSRSEDRPNPYKIPDVTELYIPDDFPDLSDKTVCEKKDYNWSYYIFRVVTVEEDKLCLASDTSIVATHIIYGSFDGEDYKKGDFIKIDVKSYYEKSEKRLYKAALKEDITKVENLTLAEAEKIINGNIKYEKPVIYLYPTKETEVKVSLKLNGILTCTYPEYKNGWDVIALPNGTIYDKKGHEYYCLYWEGLVNSTFDFTSGFCIKGSDTAAFLRETLLDIGLTQRETNEFIIYWLPLMQNNRYNIISFQTDKYEDAAQLIVEPKPDSVLRVYMTFYDSDKFIEIEPQKFKPFKRNGFTVIEWGGSQLSNME